MIKLTDVEKSFGNNKVLRGVNLEINDGETLVIIGRSGCGKSVMLKTIIGLLEPDAGEIIVEGKIINLLSKRELYEVRKKIRVFVSGGSSL